MSAIQFFSVLLASHALCSAVFQSASRSLRLVSPLVFLLFFFFFFCISKEITIAAMLILSDPIMEDKQKDTRHVDNYNGFRFE